VQKATLRYGGRDWIAWFCPEIPLSDGPYKFCGLPGLILKVYDNRMHYIFEAISIEENNDFTFVEPAGVEYVQISRNEFLKAKENFRSDIINRAKEAGLSSEAQQTAARNLQKKNNPIELR
jgi:GLPGLI family protein